MLSGEGPCGRCGRDPALGYARIGDTWYCHENLTRGATCYMRASWEQAGAPTSEILEALLSDQRSRLETLEDIAERVRIGWCKGERAGFWYRLNGPEREPMTVREQLEVYGEVVYAGEREMRE